MAILICGTGPYAPPMHLLHSIANDAIPQQYQQPLHDVSYCARRPIKIGKALYPIANFPIFRAALRLGQGL
jgi:hypothetical protein